MFVKEQRISASMRACVRACNVNTRNRNGNNFVARIASIAVHFFSERDLTSAHCYVVNIRRPAGGKAQFLFSG